MRRDTFGSVGREKPREISVGKTIGAMLGLGLVLGWASIFAIPTLVRLGISPPTASRAPFAAFALGNVWGLALAFSNGARESLGSLAAPFLLGGVFWFFAVLLGGVLVAAGLPPHLADWVPIAGFSIGAGLGCAPIIVFVVERVERARAKSTRG